ncbi:MAG: NAD(P)/FAD-dependent oxidoreductase [Ardenticatenales bacterium]|nr:NAD(P)/FAD-dependent oxidoreductase [Ardenticatenales bacterium]
MSKHVIVIGGGPAGIEAARAAAQAGAKVSLISEGPVGGRAGWHSLLPSKAWLAAADAAGQQQEGPFASGGASPAPGAILPWLQTLKETWSSQQVAELKALGVTIVSGVAALTGPNSVVVADGEGQETARLTGDALIIATGSVPFFPPNLRPNGKTVIAPRFMSALGALPASVAVIGAGATGVEAVYLFNRLGIPVTWIVDKFGVLPAYPAPAGELLAEILVRRGVRLVRVEAADHIAETADGIAVVMADGSREAAALAFVAIGRTADLGRLNLAAAGLEVAAGQFPAVDSFCQTGVAGVYAVGDAAGGPMVANRATAMARVAGRHAAGAAVAPYKPEAVVAAIYSDPQVAQVGRPGEGKTTRVNYGAGLKAHLLAETEGFVELSYDETGRILGGVAVGAHAGDVLAPVALAIQVGANMADLAAVYAAHPTLSELAFAAARQA